MKQTQKIKITALVPSDLILTVKHFTHQQTTTESLVTALKEWVAMKKLAEIGGKIRKNPLRFQKGFDKNLVRKLRSA